MKLRRRALAPPLAGLAVALSTAWGTRPAHAEEASNGGSAESSASSASNTPSEAAAPSSASSTSPTSTATAKKKPILSPDARRFLAPSTFSYWSGTERVLDGELSPATPRPFDDRTFVPALDDHLSTTAYLRGSHSSLRRGRAWDLVELAMLHDLRGGTVLGMNFRLDARERTALQAIATAVVPLPRKLWLVPTVGLGARTTTAPQLVAGSELRSDRTKRLGWTVGLEASRWSYDRTRLGAKVGGVYRIGETASLEHRVAIGPWIGPRVGGELAVQSITAALQTFENGFALYERVTLTRGLAGAQSMPPADSAVSVDVALGFRHPVGPSWGWVLQADVGSQPEHYTRYGLELTLYGTVF